MRSEAGLIAMLKNRIAVLEQRVVEATTLPNALTDSVTKLSLENTELKAQVAELTAALTAKPESVTTPKIQSLAEAFSVLTAAEADEALGAHAPVALEVPKTTKRKKTPSTTESTETNNS